MTINEKKQLSNYIKGLVRESLGEMDSMPSWWNDKYGHDDEDGSDNDEISDEFDDYPAKGDGFDDYPAKGDGFDDYPAKGDGDDFWEEYGHEQPGMNYGGPDVTTVGYDWFGSPKYEKDDKSDDNEPAGLDELRQLAESYARSAVKSILMEKKKKSKSKKIKKRKNKKEKTSSRDKTVLDFFKSDGVNKAAYAYDLYNAKTDDEKASARSKFYKQLYGKKNDTGVPYKFKSQQIAHLANRRNKKIKV